MALKLPRKPIVNKAEEEITLNVRVDPTSETDTLYSNHVDISHTLHEFTLSFARIPARFPKELLETGKATGVIVLEPAIQVMVPPTLIKPLMKALERQYHRYEEDIDKANEKAG